MRNLCLPVLCAGVAVASLTPALGYDFTTANQLFAERGQGVQATEAAIAAFDEALRTKTLVSDETIYAVEKKAQLHAYRANLIPRSQISERKSHYDACMQTAKLIAPQAISSESPAYYFWYGACFALRSESEGVTQSLSKSGQIFKVLEQGRKLDPTYEGGGFDRVIGALYAKLPPFNPFGPAGDVQKALQHLELSLESAAYGESEYPESSTGDYFFETYWYYGQTLNQAGRRDEARAQVEEALERIGDGDVPEHRLPETMIAKALLEALLQELDL